MIDENRINLILIVFSFVENKGWCAFKSIPGNLHNTNSKFPKYFFCRLVLRL